MQPDTIRLVPDQEVVMNIVILIGHLSSAPRRTELPSGTTRWNLEVSCPDPSGRLASVPVSWDGSVPVAWDAATPVVVTGSVRRRFFRAGGSTQSRTEVAALAVVEITRRRPERAAMVRALRSHQEPVAAALRSVLGAPPAA